MSLYVLLCLSLTPNPNLSNSDQHNSDVTTSSQDTTAWSGSESSGDTRNSWVEGEAQESSHSYYSSGEGTPQDISGSSGEGTPQDTSNSSGEGTPQDTSSLGEGTPQDRSPGVPLISDSS